MRQKVYLKCIKNIGNVYGDYMETIGNEIYELACITQKIKTLEAELKELKGYEEQYKGLILEKMEKQDREDFESDELRIKYVKPVDMLQVDSLLLRNKYPEVYAEVVKVLQRKASLRITLKKGK